MGSNVGQICFGLKVPPGILDEDTLIDLADKTWKSAADNRGFMRPKNIILIRHGQSEGNINPEIYRSVPDYAIQLTPTGVKQAYQAGCSLRSIIGDTSVKFYNSPFWRARQTLQEILKSFPNVKWSDRREDPRLREQDWYGYISDCTPEEGERNEFGTFYYRFKSGGESGADVYDRVSDFLQTLFRDFQKPDFPENVVIIAHGMLNRIFVMRFLHAQIEEFETWANPKNGQSNILQLQGDGKYKLLNNFEIKSPENKFRWLEL